MKKLLLLNSLVQSLNKFEVTRTLLGLDTTRLYHAGLNDGEIAILKRWIDGGADWPDRFAGADRRLQYWAWQEIKSISEQELKNISVHPIDYFINSFANPFRIQNQGLILFHTVIPEADAERVQILE